MIFQKEIVNKPDAKLKRRFRRLVRAKRIINLAEMLYKLSNL